MYDVKLTDITCFHYVYDYAYVWNEFRFLLDHVNYRTKQFNLMASSSGSGNLSISSYTNALMKKIISILLL